jgi:hypothetical protein
LHCLGGVSVGLDAGKRARACRQWRKAIERNFKPIVEDGVTMDHWVVEGSRCPICISWNVVWTFSIISAVVLLIGWWPITALWLFGIGVVALNGIVLFIQRRS